MLECRDIDALMIDWLYQELERDQQAPFDAHVDDCARCRGELESLRRTRELMRDLPDAEPPSSITAILLHEAAKQAPAATPSRVAVALADEDEPRGILAWLASLLNPIVAHPAATAVATLVLVAGIAGSVYLRGDHRVTEAVTASDAPAPAAAEQMAPGTGEPAMVRLPDDDNAGRWDDLAKEEAKSAEIANGLDTLAENQATDGRLAAAERSEAPQSPTAGKLKKKKPVSTKAVTGSDMLVDLADAEGEESGRANRGFADGTVAQDPAPPPEAKPAATKGSRYRVYKDDEVGQQELAWAQGKKAQLDKALQLKKCRDAAKIANDILDRNPDYYYEAVTNDKSIKTCSGFVEDERQRRTARRTKAKRKPSKKAGASKPADAKAAPAEDAFEADTAQ